MGPHSKDGGQRCAGCVSVVEASTFDYAGVACLLLVLLASPVAAQPQGDAEPPYSLEIVLADAASWAIGVAGGYAARERSLRVGDVVGTAWGVGAGASVAIHGLHGQRGIAMASLGMRLGIPPLVSLGGIAVGCLASGIEDGCASSSARWGFGLGAVGVGLIDALVLARIPEPATTRTWYGWQAGMLDAALLFGGIAVLASSERARTADETGVGLAVLPWVGGFLLSPWVHAFHGRWGTALGSLGMRALGPGLGAAAGVAGYCAASGGDGGCSGKGAAYGFFGGALLVAIIDDALLAWAPSDGSAQAPSVVPWLVPMAGGIGVGVSGAL